jgi:hypothetical protein
MGDRIQATDDTDQPGGVQTRRAFFKTVAYATPAILTLAATPALATPGSSKERDRDWAWQDQDGEWHWSNK